MEAAEMRSLLKRMCNSATARARKLGFDVDFERGLYIEACYNIWRVCCCYSKYVQLVSDNGECLKLGAKFMSYVPSIDRLIDVPTRILESSPVGQLYLRDFHAGVVVLPLVDEFAYKFSDTALEMILRMFMQHGSFVLFQNPSEAEVKKMLVEREKTLHDQLKALLAEKNHMTKTELSSKVKSMFDEFDSWRHSMAVNLAPVRVPIVPRPCQSLDELGIMLDCYEVE